MCQRKQFYVQIIDSAFYFKPVSFVRAAQTVNSFVLLINVLAFRGFRNSLSPQLVKTKDSKWNFNNSLDTLLHIIEMQIHII